MSEWLRKLYKKTPILIFDCLAIFLAWYMAFWLNYDLKFMPQALLSTNAFVALLVITNIQIGSYYYFKVYRGLWYFTSANDILRILNAVAATCIIAIIILYCMGSLASIPRSIIPLYLINLIGLLSGARLITKLCWENHHQSQISKKINRVLIIGAGCAGESLVRELIRSGDYIPLGFIDDNERKQDLEIHGVKVLGSLHNLKDLTISYRINLVFIAAPSAGSAAMRRIVTCCEACKIPFRTLPSIAALAAGCVEVNALRTVNLDDLLGRDQIQLHWDKISTSIKNKRVVITGGGGSIGSELCRQVLQQNPNQLLIIDNSEFNLYTIEQECIKKSCIQIKCALLSVTDHIGIENIFQQFKPQIVLHAAAFKHVPMLETQLRIAVQNNVIGTQVVAEASVASGVEKFILISTDKAVNPSSIMGMTKRVAEIYCQNLNNHVDTQFITVRFGNVLGSAGSVIPLFKQQLQDGGPLTVTHPDMQRYFMTIPEACQLILQAMVNGDGGEIFVLDMGQPIKISYLAEQLIKLSGKEPYTDVAIEYIGLRPGEKLFEELFHPSEELVPTEHKKLLQAKFRKLIWDELLQTMYQLKTACAVHDDRKIAILLHCLVPEFCVTETNMRSIFRKI